MKMSNKVKAEIIKLLKSNRKIHRNTEAKLDRIKNQTVIYKELSHLYDKEIKKEKIEDLELMQEYELINKEDFIEYIRFKYIAIKIDIIGNNNPINTYEFLKILLKGKDQEIKSHIKEEVEYYIGKDSSYGTYYGKGFIDSLEVLENSYDAFIDSNMAAKLDYAIRSINIINQATTDAVKEMSKLMEEGEVGEAHKISLVRNMMGDKDLDEKTMEKIMKEIKDYLSRNKPRIPLHNLRQAIILFKIQNLEKNAKLNNSLKLLKSYKTSLNKLNFKNEENLIKHLYDEIEQEARVIYNLEYYILERSMGFEFKKLALKTLKDMKNQYEDLDPEKGLRKLYNIQDVKNIKIYEKLACLYKEVYPNDQVFINILNTYNELVSVCIRGLEEWEANGWIGEKEILQEVRVFPRLYTTKNYRNSYKMRKDFFKEEYESYNKLMASARQEAYKLELEKWLEVLWEHIMHITLLGVAESKLLKTLDVDK